MEPGTPCLVHSLLSPGEAPHKLMGARDPRTVPGSSHAIFQETLGTWSWGRFSSPGLPRDSYGMSSAGRQEPETWSQLFLRFLSCLW